MLQLDVSYPSDGIHKQNWFVVGITNLILAPITFLINFLTITALRNIKNKNTITNYILVSLCATDMLTRLLLAQSVFGAFYLNVHYESVTCSLFLFTVGNSYFFVSVSFCTLFVIQTERFLGVFLPFKHEPLAANRCFKRKIILASWISSCILVLASIFTPHLILHTIAACMFIPSVFIWSCYVQIKIVFEVHKITKNIHKIRPQTENNKNDMERYIRRVNSRANRTAGLIIVAYIICYTPNIIISICRYFDGESETLLAMLVWAETLVYLNSIFNPLLFCLQKKDVRQRVKLENGTCYYGAAKVKQITVKKVKCGLSTHSKI